MTVDQLLTFVVPCFNGRRYLEDLSRDLAARDRNRTSVIFVDDGSSDGSAEFFKQLEPDAVVVQQENSGVAEARNHGARLATTEWLVFLDCDDWLDVEALNAALDTIASSGADVMTIDWGMELVDATETSLGPMTSMDFPEDPLPALVSGEMWGPPHAYLVRRSRFWSIGGGDRTLVNAQDFDVWARLALHGARFEHLDGVTARYRRFMNTRSLARRNHDRYFADYERALKKLLAEAEVAGRLDTPFRHAFARRLHWVARNVLQSNRAQYRELSETIDRVCPEFSPFGSKMYRTFCTFLGRRAADMLAEHYNRMMKS